MNPYNVYFTLYKQTNKQREMMKKLKFYSLDALYIAKSAKTLSTKNNIANSLRSKIAQWHLYTTIFFNSTHLLTLKLAYFKADRYLAI